MVLENSFLSKVSKIFKKGINYLLLILFGYGLINIIHLCYYISWPENGWGIGVFLMNIIWSIFGYIIILLVLAFAMVGLFSAIRALISKPRIKDFGYVLLIFTLTALIIHFKPYQSNGLIKFFTPKYSYKNSYIGRTEKSMFRNEFTQAYNLAQKAYKKYSSERYVSKFYYLTYEYKQTERAIFKELKRRHSALYNLGFCTYKMGKLNKAQELLESAFKLSDTTFLKSDIDLKKLPLQLLKDIADSKGDIKKKEYYTKLEFQINNEIENKSILDNFTMVENHASDLLRSGDFEKARSLRYENLSMIQNEFDKLNNEENKMLYLMALLTATSSDFSLNNYENAGKNLVMLKSKMDDNNAIIKNVFLNFKITYCMMAATNGSGEKELLSLSWFHKAKNYILSKSISEQFQEEAFKCAEESIEIAAAKNGKNSLSYLQSLDQMGRLYMTVGRFAEANGLYSELITLFKNNRIEDRTLYNTIELNSLYCRSKISNAQGMIEEIKAFENSHFNELSNRFSFYSEKQRETYKNIFDKNIDPINSIYLNLNTNESIGRLYNNIIASKEIALYANEYVRSIINKLPRNIKLRYYQVLKMQDSLGGNTYVDSLQKELLFEEKNIINQLSSVSGFKQFNPREITWQQISSKLSKNEAAIEFIKAPGINNEVLYYVLILMNNVKAPVLIPICSENKIKSILNQPGNSEKRIQAIYVGQKDSLYKLIWKPIESHLNGKSKVYISLSGILNSISFPAILADYNKEIAILGSTRQLALDNKNLNIKLDNVTLFGGAKYGGDERSNKNSTRSFFSNLPYTKTEVQNIKRILDKNIPDNKTNIYLNENANEINFRLINKNNPRIIHLATHAYFYPNNDLSMSWMDDKLNNPMAQSGIVLSKVNERNLPRDADGNLSSMEIAKLDFSNVQLVVLSACETGLGKEIGSEGVFGLQRAFKLAGANNIIMSLWKVPDKQTAEFMTIFYSHLTKGVGLETALNNTRFEMRESYKNPYYWAGFILISS